MTTAATDATSQEQPAAGCRLVEPADAAELARELAAAASAGLAVVPRGGGTKSDWANAPPRADMILSTRRLDRVLEHAAGDMTATVEAGCTIADLQKLLALRGQRLAIDPLWEARATVGGVLATNDNGTLRGAYGGLRDLIIGVTVALADGTLARSGGKVVKNVAGYDLPKLMVGAFGTLGVITRATFRLHPLPQATRTFAFSSPTPQDAARLVLAVQDSTLAPAAVQFVATSAGKMTIAVRVEGSAGGIETAAERLHGLAARHGATSFDCAEDTWMEREQLWDGRDVICKATFLPSRIADVCGALRRCAGEWKLVAQAVGVGLLGIRPSQPHDIPATVSAIRRELEELGGSLVVLRCPPDVTERLDVWGDVGATLALMRRVKQQLDPGRVLNPGRFVGGI